jgi:hypothetical protein
LLSYAPLRRSGARLQVTSRDGTVTVGGNVRSVTMKAMAGRLAQSVRGVARVVNEVRSDTEIETSAALALAGDPSTALLTDKLFVKCVLGTLYLGGVIEAERIEQAQALRETALELVRAVADVQAIVDELVMREAAAVSGEPVAEEETVTGRPSAEEEKKRARLAVWRERAEARQQARGG